MRQSSHYLLFLVLFIFSCSNQKSIGKVTKTKNLAIEQVINNYFQGRKTADIELLKTTFHSDARLLTMDTALVLITREAYLDVVKKKGAVSCQTKLLYYTVDGKRAFAKTKFDYGDRIYEDYLVLVNINEKWWIVNKTFERIK